MAKEDLIPFNTMSKDKHLALSKRGGKVRSLAKSEGAKLRCIKERIQKQIANSKDVDWLLQKLNDRPSMAAELLLTIEKMKQDGVHPAQKIALGNLEQGAAKFIHGDRIKTENVNININTGFEEWEKRISNLLDEDED